MSHETQYPAKEGWITNLLELLSNVPGSLGCNNCQETNFTVLDDGHVLKCNRCGEEITLNNEEE